MSESFKDVERTIRRAERHVESFQNHVGAFLDNMLAEQTMRYDAWTDQFVFGIKLPTVMPEEIAESADDAIHRMRSALDHACHAASIALNTHEPGRTNFPIMDTEKGFERRLATNSNFRGIPERLYDSIKSFKPFATCADGSNGNLLLVAMNKWANSNKHRRPLIVSVLPGSVGIRHLSQMSMITTFKQVSDEEVEVLRLKPDGPNPQYDFDILPVVTFSAQSGIALGEGAEVTLSRMLELIKNVCAELKRVAGL